ncbi:unnamed protein product, partial [Adineta steineri]
NDNYQSQTDIRNKNNDDAEIQILQKLIEKIMKNPISSSSSTNLLSQEEIRDKLKQSVPPLLRCSALFYHHLTGTSWPVESGIEIYL